MRSEFGAHTSGFVHYKSKHRHFTCLRMYNKLEAICEKRLHHEPDLVLSRMPSGLGHYDKVIGSSPFGQMCRHRLLLFSRWHDLVCKLYINFEWEVCYEKPSKWYRCVFAV